MTSKCPQDNEVVWSFFDHWHASRTLPIKLGLLWTFSYSGPNHYNNQGLAVPIFIFMEITKKKNPNEFILKFDIG